MLALYEQEGNQETINRLKIISPVAWSHINLFGCYKFGKPLEQIDWVRVIAGLARMPVPPNSDEEIME